MVAGGHTHSLGLKSDGTVIAAGSNQYGQCDVDGWTDIVQVSAGRDHVVGLKTDGTVVSTGLNTYGELDVQGWNLIVATAPLAISSLSATPVSGQAPLDVGFTVSAANGTPPYTFAWDFGDGATDTGYGPESVPHLYGTRRLFGI